MDWNGDGYDDIIVGDRNGFINYFRRLPSGYLTVEPQIQCAGTPIDVGYNSAPEVVDLNGDGYLDLVVGDQGTSTGTLPSLRLYLNDGAAGEPVFSSYSYVQSNGSDISLYRNMPRLIDFDLDNDKDLLCGTCIPTFIYYYENIGTNQVPVFAEPDTVYFLMDPLTGLGGLKIFCAPVDVDMQPDIFVSDLNGSVDLYLSNYGGVSEEACSPLDPAAGVLSISGSPTYGQFVATLNLAQGSEIRLLTYRADGRIHAEVLSGPVSAGQHSFTCDLSGGPAGIYLIVLCSSDGTFETGRVVLLGN